MPKKTLPKIRDLALIELELIKNKNGISAIQIACEKDSEGEEIISNTPDTRGSKKTKYFFIV